MSSPGSNSTDAAGPPPPPPMWTPEQLAAMPHNDVGTTVIAVLWPLVAVAALFSGLRIFCKRLTSKSLWWDDYFLIAAWASRFNPLLSPSTHDLPPVSTERPQPLTATRYVWLSTPPAGRSL